MRTGEGRARAPRRLALGRAPLLLLLGLGASACTNEPVVARGACLVEADPEPRCGAAVADGGTSASLGLVAYACTGVARPDDQATYSEGIPRGFVCADRPLAADGDTHGYCCTKETTPCAYDPVATCDASMFGFECRGANRPESLNPALTCGMGVRHEDLIDYCCSGTPQPDGCVQSDSVPCSTRLMGWTCKGKSLPRGEELGANRSRADSFGLLCPVATPAGNPAYNNYCCYTAALVPQGGTCVQDTVVAGCEPGRFGFACYGPDTPEDDFLPMRCPGPGFAGRSAEGYPATLYCCDFQ